MPVGILIGNSRLRYASFDEEGRWSEVRALSWDELGGLGGIESRLGRELEGASSEIFFGASVRDDRIPRVEHAVPRVSAKIRWARRDFPIGIENRYRPPEDVGTDRLLNARALRDLHPGRAAIAVDLGTALSVSVVSPEGAFVGGLIACGSSTANLAMRRATPALPHVTPRREDRTLRDTTEGALATGLHRQFAWGVRGVLCDLIAELGGEAEVVATGGEAPLYAPVIDEIDRVDPDLTFRGLVSAALEA